METNPRTRYDQSLENVESHKNNVSSHKHNYFYLDFYPKKQR